MSEELEQEELEFPQIYKNKDGVKIIANNEIQGAAFKNQGFEPAGKYVEKKPGAQQ